MVYTLSLHDALPICSISVNPDSLCNLNLCIYSISFYFLIGFICYSVFNHSLPFPYSGRSLLRLLPAEDFTLFTFNPFLHHLLRAFPVRRITAAHAQPGPADILEAVSARAMKDDLGDQR